MKRLCEGIWELGHPLFNAYLVRGADRAALVEVGISAVASRLVGELDALGVAPDLLVVTHPHTDHLSGLGALRERFPGAEVVVGPGAPGFVGHPKAAAGFVAEDRYMAEALASRGEAVAAPALGSPPDLSGAREVGEGARIDLGGLTLEAWVAGGHAPGNLVVRVPERGALFVSDCLGFRYGRGGFMPLYFTGYGPYLDTLERIRAWGPEVLGLGHLGALAGPAAREAVAAARAAAEALRERVLAHRGSDEDLAERLFAQVYRDELTCYSPANIRMCVGLLIRRSREAEPCDRPA